MDSYGRVNDRRGPSAHLIARVSYPFDYIECTCGFTGKAAGAVEWMAHRRDVGQPVSLSVILGPAKARKAMRVVA